MKIILISFLYEPELGGGAAQVVFSLAKSLHSEGIEVVVITSAPQGGNSVEWQAGIKIIRFYPRNLYWVYDKDLQPPWKKVLWQVIDTWNPLVYWKLKQVLQAEAPDIVHVHKLRGLSPAVWNAARSAGVQVLVHTCHDYELFSPEGTLSGRVGRLAENQAFVLKPYQALRRRLSNQVSKASSPSQFSLDLHTTRGFF